MNTAYVALGSNIDPRKTYFQEAIRLLGEHPSVKVERFSALYETDPVGYVEQEDFLNMVIMLSTSLEPLELLDVCQNIELELGRERLVKWGPRTIDLDILAFNRKEINTERLVLPHPHLHERAFALIPLADVEKKLLIRNDGKSVEELVEGLSEQEWKAVRKVDCRL
ncbi:2-amino-4-hydroxy-6-hydroxymethyldihydropteridine diphosphokinase [Salimicrobium album]|uniref:2-amino-4-hydroxy-6-hydroxymethyldihydropteridine diphosphokinase n=1 Tax=Salimicrobium album TaxID=50717 RepID=A0A1H3J942_9BACI|nr:2-amino-4-hydroxy-6-hydroxymethyldihydropteridine diphosphokinase [Salimicrobium album]SDY36530.1 2-amino-4-hydroxy-6-hydroxymethyldihydropteridinediphosphokinase [Salimicrobium album]